MLVFGGVNEVFYNQFRKKLVQTENLQTEVQNQQPWKRHTHTHKVPSPVPGHSRPDLNRAKPAEWDFFRMEGEVFPNMKS